MQNPKFIEINLAIAFHDDLIESLGGSFGIRDENLLHSALAQPKATFFGEYLHPTIAYQAAAYLYHISKNHAFVDGNKRTSLGVMEAFLGLNDCDLDLSDDELYELVISTVTGKLEKEQIAEVIQKHLIVNPTL